MRNRSVQGLRALFAIGVLLSHSTFLKGYPSSTYIFERILSKTAVVSFFFMIAGFYASNLKPSIKFGEYIKHKIQKIYPLYLLMILVNFSLIVLRNGFDFNSAKGYFSLLANILMIQNWWFDISVVTSIYTVAWFLSSLFFCYIMSFWLLRWCQGSDAKWKVVGLLCGLLMCFKIVMAIYHPTDDFGNYYCYFFPLAGFADFLLGMMIGYNIRKVKLPDAGWGIFQILSLFVMIVTIWSKFYIPSNYCRAFVAIPATAMVVSAFSHETKLSRTVFGNRLMVFVGDLSFEIYLLHIFTMGVMSRFGITKFISTYASPFVALVFNIAFCILIAVICKKIMGVILSKIYKLSGGKNNV